MEPAVGAVQPVTGMTHAPPVEGIHGGGATAHPGPAKHRGGYRVGIICSRQVHDVKRMMGDRALAVVRGPRL